MNGKFVEKRRFPRIPYNSQIRYQVRGSKDFDNVLGKDISSGGLRFSNDEYIAPKTVLMMEVNILAKVLNFIGKVSWTEPLPHANDYQFGVEFLETDCNNMNFLNDFIDMQLANH